MACACCRGEETSQSALTRQLLVLGISSAISLTFLLAAGIKYAQWLPMLNLIYVVLTPMAVIVAEGFGSSSSMDGYNEVKAAWTNFAGCFFGIILTSLFGLPLLLFGNSIVSGPALGLWLASTVVTFIASLYYWISRAKTGSSY